MEKEKKDWFTELFPEVPPEYPPDLKIKGDKPHRITFEEKRPRIVTGGFDRSIDLIGVLVYLILFLIGLLLLR